MMMSQNADATLYVLYEVERGTDTFESARSTVDIACAGDSLTGWIRYYVDGGLVRSVENAHWRQPLFLIFDSETMPQWLGMPNDNDLPSTFSVEDLRAWKQK